MRNDFGESLNDLVEWVENHLSSFIPELNMFKLKLYEIGYFDLHKPLYQNIGYTIRQENIYKVEDEFPRITEEEIRNGVGDVKYTIVIADCLFFQK